ncbi:MAG: citryl-CoA lyase [Chloroflexi bacterium]|nr:citryl-CoA lyase [Chloroflexota bacterium]
MAPAAASKSDEEEGGPWKTAITEIQPNAIRLRGHTLDSLMGSVTFGQAIYLALVGDLPTPQMGRLIDAILVASIDHGATPPSTLAARTAASTGAPFNAAIAAGLLSINQHHGGAIEDCMRMMQGALKNQHEQRLTADEAAAALVKSYKENKKRLPGFGHRIHTDDPRTRRLLAIAQEEGVAGEAVAMVQALARAVAQSGKALPINVDGAIAALLLDMKIAPELGNTFFMIARLPGLIAHVHEEKTRERPMRVIHPTNHTYDGKT